MDFLDRIDRAANRGLSGGAIVSFHTVGSLEDEGTIGHDRSHPQAVSGTPA
jgi:hypothetical protein